jgi:hypothetical protein
VQVDRLPGRTITTTLPERYAMRRRTVAGPAPITVRDRCHELQGTAPDATIR